MINKDWYRSLKKSRLTPPDRVFGIVWAILYTLLSVAFYGMISAKDWVGLCRPLVFFSAQMLLNVVWSTLFFRYKMVRVSLLSIVCIIVLTSLTLVTVYDVNVWVAYLLIPYLLWLLLAGYLNLYIVWYN